MMHKQSVVLDKPWLASTAMGLHLSGIFARLRNAVRVQIPTGYQDETGFHTGVKVAREGIQWPSVW
jgi:hypothetical protein